MRLPFGLGAYSRGDGRLPPVRLVNMFAESAPTAKTGFALIQRPGLELQGVRGTNVRGLYRQDGVFSGDLFVVSGGDLYRNSSSVGAIAGSDLTEWTYTIDGFRVLGGGVIHHYDGTDVIPDDFPDDAGVASLTSINSILVAVRADIGFVYYRLPGETEWGGLDYFAAEREPDPAIAVRALGDELWVFGTASIEAFAPTGDADTPFIRIQGRGIQRGAKSRDSIVQMDNTLFWVGEDSIVYRADNIPVRVSNHGIEERVQASSGASAWSYSLSGHTFYVLNLDSETLALDVATGEWHQLKVYDRDGFVRVGMFDGGTTWLGGGEGQVWTFADRADDEGQPLERVFTSIIPTDAPLSCDRLLIDLSPGTSGPGEDATLLTRWSDDQGRTWGDWKAVSCGFQGDYRNRAVYRRCGMVDAPGRVIEHRITDPAIIRVSGVEMNPPLGGRSR